jgi:hypothetical protein
MIEVEIVSHEVPFDGEPARLALATDVTEKKSLATQLLRAQRMESIGTLAPALRTT